MESISVFIILILPLVLLAIRTILYRQKPRNPPLPPGPPGLPLIGNLHQLDGTPLHEYFWRLSKKYGPLVYMKLGSRPVLAANSLRMAEEVLKIQDHSFCSRPTMLALGKFSYGGLDVAFAPYGEYWREIRKASILNLLSSKQVQYFRPIREDEVCRMIQKISEHGTSQPIDLTEVIMFLTSTIICRIAFGKRYEQGSGESTQFNHIIQEFLDAISAFCLSDYFPLLGWVDKLTGKLDRIDKVFRRWDSFYQQLIDEHLRPDRPKSMEGDVVDVLLQLTKENSASSHPPSDIIKAVLMNVYFAATDTIATTIIWAMTALMKNPSAMRAAQAELRALPSLHGKQMVEEEDIAASERLPYFNSVLRESLRMYSTLPLLLPRETIKKCTIDGFEIPAGTLVHVNAWAIGNDPELWENPNDFLPERFLSDAKMFNMDLKGQDLRLIPFGAGRRGCPGVAMAMATVEIVVANLLYVFDWEMPDGLKNEDIDTQISAGINLHKKNPIRLVARKFV